MTKFIDHRKIDAQLVPGDRVAGDAFDRLVGGGGPGFQPLDGLLKLLDAAAPCSVRGLHARSRACFAALTDPPKVTMIRKEPKNYLNGKSSLVLRLYII
jgi:hypothetical protein